MIWSTAAWKGTLIALILCRLSVSVVTLMAMCAVLVTGGRPNNGDRFSPRRIASGPLLSSRQHAFPKSQSRAQVNAYYRTCFPALILDHEGYFSGGLKKKKRKPFRVVSFCCTSRDLIGTRCQ